MATPCNSDRPRFGGKSIPQSIMLQMLQSPPPTATYDSDDDHGSTEQPATEPATELTELEPNNELVIEPYPRASGKSTAPTFYPSSPPSQFLENVMAEYNRMRQQQHQQQQQRQQNDHVILDKLHTLSKLVPTLEIYLQQQCDIQKQLLQMHQQQNEFHQAVINRITAVQSQPPPQLAAIPTAPAPASAPIPAATTAVTVAPTTPKAAAHGNGNKKSAINFKVTTVPLNDEPQEESHYPSPLAPPLTSPAITNTPRSKRKTTATTTTTGGSKRSRSTRDQNTFAQLFQQVQTAAQTNPLVQHILQKAETTTISTDTPTNTSSSSAISKKTSKQATTKTSAAAPVVHPTLRPWDDDDSDDEDHMSDDDSGMSDTTTTTTTTAVQTVPDQICHQNQIYAAMISTATSLRTQIDEKHKKKALPS